MYVHAVQFSLIVNLFCTPNIKQLKITSFKNITQHQSLCKPLYFFQMLFVTLALAISVVAAEELISYRDDGLERSLRQCQDVGVISCRRVSAFCIAISLLNKD